MLLADDVTEYRVSDFGEEPPVLRLSVTSLMVAKSARGNAGHCMVCTAAWVAGLRRPRFIDGILSFSGPRTGARWQIELPAAQVRAAAFDDGAAIEPFEVHVDLRQATVKTTPRARRERASERPTRPPERPSRDSVLARVRGLKPSPEERAAPGFNFRALLEPSQ